MLSCIVLKFSSVPLQAEFLSELNKKFQESSSNDANVKYEAFAMIFFFWDMLIADTHAHTHRPTSENVIFGWPQTVIYLEVGSVKNLGLLEL